MIEGKSKNIFPIKIQKCCFICIDQQTTIKYTVFMDLLVQEEQILRLL